MAYSNSTQWACQLQDYKIEDKERIKNSKNTLWVIDYSKDGSEFARWSKNEILEFKKNNNTLLAYVSIGEAEDYRWYWEALDKSLVIKPKDTKTLPTSWDGNIPVKYWEKEWQSIFTEETLKYGKSFIQVIIDQNFDGIFIDRADVYETYYNQGDIILKQKAQEMSLFIQKLVNKAKSIKPNFKVYIQNSTSMIDLLKNPDELYNIIDGQAIESLYFRGKLPEDNTYNPDKWVHAELKRIQQKYKLPVINVEYIYKRKQDMNLYITESKKDDLIPFVSKRSLDGSMIIIK